VVPGRISPEGEKKNVFGPQLRKLREDRGLQAKEVVSLLQMRGWDVAASSYSQIESGTRVLGDIELLMILDVLEADWNDLKRPPRIGKRRR